MIYGKRYSFQWSKTVKLYLILAIVLFSTLILTFGFLIGFSVNAKSSSLEETPPEPQAIPETVDEYYNIPLDTDLQDYIFSLCNDLIVPAPLVLAVIETESSFRANAVSNTNDYGLMQINKINHEWLAKKYNVTDFLDPYQNVFCGIHLLADYCEAYQNIDEALMVYNLGATGAKRLWDRGIYTTAYCERVKGVMNHYE